MGPGGDAGLKYNQVGGLDFSGTKKFPMENQKQMVAKKASKDAIVSAAEAAISGISSLSIQDQISVLNEIRAKLHLAGPFSNEPVDLVQWVLAEKVEGNEYNPNSVAPPEMELLRLSIVSDGYTQPIVANNEEDIFRVVDGFHRNRVGKECEDVKARIHGYLPVVQIRASQSDKPDRIASTVRHNRARGKHRVDGMSDIVLELRRRNWSNEKIGKQLGMDPDEVLRLAQITGLAEMFKDHQFSEAWEADRIDEDVLGGEIDGDEIQEDIPSA